ncbi:DoxX family protein [Cellulophaga fucicola]|uniref:DoxX family protein n=1 Tax=Cellulophaga fucicola TaxID=76595 RepID=UPI003EB71194
MRDTIKTNIGLALLRIVPSAIMLTHGIPKLQNFFSGEEIKFPDPIGIGASPSLFLAVIGEVLCPIFIILGYKTRWFAVPAAVTMLVAAFVQHAADNLANKSKEMAILYLLFFVIIFLLGPGRFSVDGK